MTDCVFCQKIAEGTVTRESPSVVSFEPLNPVTPGHRLFVPTPHREHSGVRAPITTGMTMEIAHMYAQEQGEDFNLITSSGDAATQTIPHIHVHYVPRSDGDGLHLPWTGQVTDSD